ncbi:MAG TPA: DUF2723 domain-containing protein [Oscillatoriaceae cyanobacterium]
MSLSSNEPSRPASPSRLTTIGAPLLVLALALWAYRQTLLPGVGVWDTAEFQAVPYLLGIMHATGYPFYTLVGKLASCWPTGSIAWRMNWFSALSAALAAAALTRAAMRLGVGWIPATAAGLALAFDAAFWQTADGADPHTLQTLLHVLIFSQAIAWTQTRRLRDLAVLALLSGFALANHLLFTLIVPALALLILLVEPALLKRPKSLAALVGCLLPGLACFAYLPLRARQNPPLDYGRPTDWPHFRKLVLGEQFHQDMGFLNLSGLESFLVQLYRIPDLVASWLTPTGMIAAFALALVGLGVLARRNWRLAIFFLAAGLVPLYVACTWIDGGIERYFFTTTAVLLLLAALGAQGILDSLRHIPVRWASRALAGVLLLALLAGPLMLMRQNWLACDRHTERGGQQFADAVYSRLKPDAVILTVWIDSTPLWYTHFVEGRRPDVTILDESNVITGNYGSMNDAIAAWLGKRPVYLCKPSYDVATARQRFTVRDCGPMPRFGYDLVEVLPPSKP